jgi:hypothetical protein
MNAIDGLSSGLTVLQPVNNTDVSRPLAVSENQPKAEDDSFQSVLHFLDVNADGKIDSNELKFGVGFMINQILFANELNGDQALPVGDAGLSPEAIAQPGPNSNQLLGTKEKISAADKVIDGLVSLLDTDGDQALSKQELAIFEFLFRGISWAAGKEIESLASQQASESVQPAPPEPEAPQGLEKMVSLKA